MWYDRAEEEIENQLESGDMTQSEYKEAMRALRDEYEQCRQDAADEAYNNY